MDNITSPSPRWEDSGRASLNDVEYVSDGNRDSKEAGFISPRVASPDIHMRPYSQDSKHMLSRTNDTDDIRHSFHKDDIMLSGRRPYSGGGRDAGNTTQDSSKASSIAHGHNAVDSVFQREHVDVRAAEEAFTNLSRQLSRASHAALSQGDPEAQDVEGEFDLLAFLQHVDSQASKAGIKRKNIHVVWTDLSVQGVATTTLHLK